VKFSVKEHIEPGNHILTHSVLLFLVFSTPPCYHCSDRPQARLSLFHRPLWWPNRYSSFWSDTHIPVLCGFQSFNAILNLDICFVVCLPVVIDHVWFIQVTIPVKPIFGVGNSLRCTIIITFGWLMVDSFDLVDIWYLSLLSREVLCRQSGSQQ